MAETVIDADGHDVEPLLGRESAPVRHRPHIHRDDAGYEYVVLGDQEIVAVSLGLLATPGSDIARDRQSRSRRQRPAATTP